MVSEREESRENKKMIITILGHEVTLQFAEEANHQIALQIKEALLGTYLLTGK